MTSGCNHASAAPSGNRVSVRPMAGLPGWLFDPDSEAYTIGDFRWLKRRCISKQLSNWHRLSSRKRYHPVEVTESILNRIQEHDPHYKSYATVMADQARASAQAAEQAIGAGNYLGRLHGVLIGIKDLCFTKGVATMGATKALMNHIPDFDCTVVEKLNAAGAVILGKLNLTEGAMAGYNPEFQVPVNPWGTNLWSGASSSGSGVATSAGLCYGSLGSDTGGSIRFPSAACGIVGLKPTWGRVSRYGVLALAESLDHIGPMVRSWWIVCWPE